MKIKKLLPLFTLANLAIGIAGLLVPDAVSAATFVLEPQTRTVAPDEQFTVDIKIDTGGEEVTSADALLEYNSSVLKIESVTPGDFFPQNFKAITNKLLVSGAVQNLSQAKAGSGTLATIVFRAAAAGTARLTFDCTPGKTADSNISKRDDTASDILDCAQLADGSYTVSGKITPSAPTPTPKTLPKAGNAITTLLFGGAGLILTIIGIMSML